MKCSMSNYKAKGRQLEKANEELDFPVWKGGSSEGQWEPRMELKMAL